MNPLFQMLNNTPVMANANSLMQRFQQFRNGFSGNAQQQVMQMLNSGRITPQQYQSAVQMAQQFQGLIK